MESIKTNTIMPKKKSLLIKAARCDSMIGVISLLHIQEVKHKMEGKNLILIGNKNRRGNINWDGGAFVIKYMVFKIRMIKELKMGPISFLLVELAIFTVELPVFSVFTRSILCLVPDSTARCNLVFKTMIKNHLGQPIIKDSFSWHVGNKEIGTLLTIWEELYAAWKEGYWQAILISLEKLAKVMQTTWMQRLYWRIFELRRTRSILYFRVASKFSF